MISGRYNPGTVYWFRGIEGGGAQGRFGEREVLLDAKTGQRAPMMSTTNTFDYDGDGDFDLFIGSVDGRVFLAENEGTPTEPMFSGRKEILVDGEPLKVVQKSDALPIDWDGDGIMDLLVGDEACDVSFFRGIEPEEPDGERFAPGVSLMTGHRVKPKERYLTASKRIKRAGKLVPGYRLRLHASDWNGDGKLDLLVGNCEKLNGETSGMVRVFLRR